MKLNTIKPAEGSKTKKARVGRGIGSGLGKNCGKGHKGQKSRSGGYHKVGFEGGQMPHQRRLPKFGFNSLLSRQTAEVRLSELDKLDVSEVNLTVLKDKGVVKRNIRYAKVILSGTLNKAVALKGLRATKGAKEAILKAGGTVDME